MDMQAFRLCVIVALVVAAMTALGAAGKPALAGPTCNIDQSASAIDAQEQEMLRLINEYRRNNGQGLLQLSNTLNTSAAWKSQDMADNAYFAHDDTPIGRSWTQRFHDCGYGYNTFTGEIIAAGNKTAAGTFEQWRGSPGHSANMLNANYSAIGIGRAYNASSPYGWYWTADFGGVADGYTPAPPPEPAQPPPTPDPTGPIPTGDANCDRYVNSIDALLMLQLTAGLISSLPCQQEADADGDGQITAIESALILQFVAGLLPALPA